MEILICGHCGNAVQPGYTLCGVCGAEYKKKWEGGHKAIVVITALVIFGLTNGWELTGELKWGIILGVVGVVAAVIDQKFVEWKWWRHRMQ